MDVGGISYVVDIDTRAMLELDSMSSKISKKLESDFAKMDRAVKAYESSLKAANMKILESGKVVNAFGQVNQAATEKLAGLNAELATASRYIPKAASNLGSMNTQLTKTAQGVSKSRLAMGQLGYQIQDIANMVAFNASPFTIIATQGGQIASIFGPGGAVIGAVIGVAAVMAGALTAGVGAATDSIDEMYESIEKLSQAEKNLLALKIQDEMLSSSGALDNLYAKRLVLTQTVEKTEQRISDLRAKGGLFEAAFLSGEIKNLADYKRELIEVSAAEEAVERRRASLIDMTGNLDDATRKNAETLKSNAAEVLNMIKSLDLQAKTFGMSAKGAGLYTAQLLGASDAQLKALETSYNLIEAKEREAEADKRRAEALNDSLKAAQAAEKEWPKQQARAIEQTTQFTQLGEDPLDKINRVESERLALIAQYQAQNLINIQAYEDAKTAIQREATESRNNIIDSEKASQMNAVNSILGATSSGFDALAGIMEAAQGKQSSAYQAMFAMSKAFQLGQAGLNLWGAIMSAYNAPDSLTTAQKIGNAAAIAGAAGGVMSSLQGVTMGGGRLYGGATQAGKAYRVNENGRPEMFTNKSGQQFMMGGGGHVTPASDIGGNTININQSFVFDGGTPQDQQTMQQFAQMSKAQTMQIIQQEMRQGGMLAR